MYARQEAGSRVANADSACVKVNLPEVNVHDTHAHYSIEWEKGGVILQCDVMLLMVHLCWNINQHTFSRKKLGKLSNTFDASCSHVVHARAHAHTHIHDPYTHTNTSTQSHIHKHTRIHTYTPLSPEMRELGVSREEVDDGWHSTDHPLVRVATVKVWRCELFEGDDWLCIKQKIEN